jgi:hypothetical protein
MLDCTVELDGVPVVAGGQLVGPLAPQDAGAGGLGI